MPAFNSGMSDLAALLDAVEATPIPQRQPVNLGSLLDEVESTPVVEPQYKPVLLGAAQSLKTGLDQIGQTIMAGPALVEAGVRRFVGPTPSADDPTPLGSYLKLQQQQQEAEANAASYDRRPGIAGFGQEVLDSAAGSLPAMAAPIAAGITAKVPAMASQTAQALARLKASSLVAGLTTTGQSVQQDPSPRGVANAVVQGLLEAGFMRLGGATGVEALFKSHGPDGVRQGFKAAIKNAAHEAGHEIPEEALTSMAQDASDQVIRQGQDFNPDQNLRAGAVGGATGGILGAGFNAKPVADAVVDAAGRAAAPAVLAGRLALAPPSTSAGGDNLRVTGRTADGRPIFEDAAPAPASLTLDQRIEHLTADQQLAQPGPLPQDAPPPAPVPQGPQGQGFAGYADQQPMDQATALARMLDDVERAPAPRAATTAQEVPNAQAAPPVAAPVAPGPIPGGASEAPGATAAPQAPVAPQPKGWQQFGPETGSLNIPRSEMPQIDGDKRGALANFLRARGISWDMEDVDPQSLRPTQAEWHPAKVEKARKNLAAAGDQARAILVSSDNHVIDGHHQAIAALTAGQSVKVVRIGAPIREALAALDEFPSVRQTAGATPSKPAAAPAPTGQPAAAPDVINPVYKSGDKFQPGPRVRFTRGKKQGTEATVTSLVDGRPILRTDDGKPLGGKAGITPDSLEAIAHAETPVRPGAEAAPVEAARTGAGAPTEKTAAPAVAGRAIYPDYSPVDRLANGKGWRIADGQGRIVGVSEGEKWSDANKNARAGRFISTTPLHKAAETAKAAPETATVPDSRVNTEPAYSPAEPADQAVVNLPLDKRGGGSLDKQINQGLAAERERKDAELRAANDKASALRDRIKALPLSAFESLANKAGMTPKQAKLDMMRNPNETAAKWLDEQAAAPEPATAAPSGHIDTAAPESLRHLDDPKRVRDITNGLYRLVNAVGDHGEVTVKPHFGEENDPVFRLDVSGKHGDGTTSEMADSEMLRQAGIILGKNGRFDFDALTSHLQKVNDAITGRKIKNDTINKANRNQPIRTPGPNDKTNAVIPDAGEQVAYSQREEESRPAIVNLDAINKDMKVGRVVAVADGWRFVAPNGRGIAIRSATADEARANEGRAEGYFTAVDANGEPAIVLIPGRTGPFTINHELVHHARRLGILTDGHLDALSRIGTAHGVAKKWAPLYKQANPDISPATLREEIAAKTVEAIKAGDINIKPSWLRSILDWFADLGRALAGMPKGDARVAREVVEGTIFADRNVASGPDMRYPESRGENTPLDRRNGSVLRVFDGGDSSDGDQQERMRALGDRSPQEDPRLRALLVEGKSTRIAVGETVSALVQGYTESRVQSFSVAGSLVHTPRDAAVLFGALRSPFVERLSWMLVGVDGRVKDSGVHSIGTVNGADMMQADDIARIVAANRAGGGDTFYVSHNHPSGNVLPSEGDAIVYRKMQDMAKANGLGFRGVITNGTRFSYFEDAYGPNRVMNYEAPAPYEAVSYDAISDPNITTVSLAAQEARRIQADKHAAVVLILSSRMTMLGASVLPPNATLAQIEDITRRNGGVGAIVSTGDQAVASRISDAVKQGRVAMVRDVVRILDNGDVLSERSADLFHWPSDPSPQETKADTLDRSVMDETPAYDPAAPRAPQERLGAARQGVDPTAKPDDRPGILAELRRHFKFLDPAKHAEAIAILRNLEAQLDGATGQAERIMLGHVDGLTRGQAEAFNDRLVLEDVLRQIEAGEFDGGPTEDGRTAEQIGEDIKRDLAKAIEKGGKPAADAYEKRRTFQQRHTRALVEADLLDPAALDDPRYYHRQVLAHLGDKTSMGLGGADARQRRRGFQKGRSGGTAADIPFYGDEEARRDFNANYAQSEFEYLAQSVQELARHDALQRLDARYNQMRAAKAEAKARNRAAMDDAWVKENTVEGTGERDEEAIGQGWDQHWRGLLAMNNAKLADLAMSDNFGGPFDDVWTALGEAREKWHGENDDLEPAERMPFMFDHPAWWKALAWLASHPEITVTVAPEKGASYEQKPAISAMSIFKAIAEREQHVKDTLGKAYQTWRDVAQDMDGQTTWQPEEGLQLVPGWAATDQAIGNALRKAGLDEATVAEALPEKAPVGGALKRGLIVMGQKPQWLIPEDLAKQLNSMRRVEDLPALRRNLETWGRRWKLWMLHQPMRVIKYQLNNLVGDLDVALTQPGIMREVFKDRMQTARDLRKFINGKPLDPKTEAEMKAAMQHGILDSGVSAAELPDVDKLPALRALFGKQGWDMSWAGIPEAAKRYFDTAQRFGRWREAIMRVSAARALYRQVSPEHRRYAASRKDELDQLYDRWQALSEQIDAISSRRDPSPADDAKVNEAEREIADLHATIAAKLARELIGDYGNLSHAGQTARRFLIPFWSWMEINAPRYVRLIKNARYEGGGGGAQAAGVVAAMGARLGIRMVALSAGVFAWNAMMRAALGMRDDEDPNKDADLAKLVIILYRDADGKIHGLRVAGALADALGWLDLDNSVQHVKALRDGLRDGNVVRAGMETAGDILQAPVNRIAQGLTPIIKVPGEQVFRKTMFPDMFKPRPLGDRYGHLADAMGVGSVYRAATDRTGWGQAAAGAMMVTHDPGMASHHRVRDDAEAWAQRNGKTIKSGGGTPKEQTNMLREAKSAFMRGEVERADRWLWKYYDMGGKPSFLGASKAAAHPLSVLKMEDQPAYLKQLSPEKRAEYSKALARWNQLWGGMDGMSAAAARAYQAWLAKGRRAG